MAKEEQQETSMRIAVSTSEATDSIRQTARVARGRVVTRRAHRPSMASRPAGGDNLPRCGSRLPCFRISRNRRAPPPYGLSSREPNDTALTSSGGGRVGAP